MRPMGRGALGARQAHGQLRPEAPLLVVPATGDISEFEVCEIRMLFPQQRSYQVLLEPELVHGWASNCQRPLAS
ncbi:hypothetical protein GCM10023196_096680 [Actinoallomurus vinaceus]|uniref:Uncharacterized protein n=1 Tax=Actinoallomurus vinaceus TaxID=1080074 RepID=A0ABP8UU05_9ACTN